MCDRRPISQPTIGVVPPAFDPTLRRDRTDGTVSSRQRFDPAGQPWHIDRRFVGVNGRPIPHHAHAVVPPTFDPSLGRDCTGKVLVVVADLRRADLGIDRGVQTAVPAPAIGICKLPRTNIDGSLRSIFTGTDQTDVEKPFIHLDRPRTGWALTVTGVLGHPRRIGQRNHLCRSQRGGRRHLDVQPVNFAVVQIGQIQNTVVVVRKQIDATNAALANPGIGLQIAAIDVHTVASRQRTSVYPQRSKTNTPQQRRRSRVAVGVGKPVVVDQKQGVTFGIARQRRGKTAHHAGSKQTVADGLIGQPPNCADLVTVHQILALAAEQIAACPAGLQRPLAVHNRSCAGAAACHRPGHPRGHIAVERGPDQAKMNFAAQAGR